MESLLGDNFSSSLGIAVFEISLGRGFKVFSSADGSISYFGVKKMLLCYIGFGDYYN